MIKKWLMWLVFHIRGIASHFESKPLMFAYHLYLLQEESPGILFRRGFFFFTITTITIDFEFVPGDFKPRQFF